MDYILNDFVILTFQDNVLKKILLFEYLNIKLLKLNHYFEYKTAKIKPLFPSVSLI